MFNVSIRPALFIAPCLYTFHYKCVRPILEAHPPSFSRPLYRTYANLDEASWEVDGSEANKPAAAAEGKSVGEGPAPDVDGEDDKMDLHPERPGIVLEE